MHFNKITKLVTVALVTFSWAFTILDITLFVTAHTKQCVEEYYPILLPTTGTAESRIAAKSDQCKLLHFIRHAEGYHNVADRKYGTDILTFKKSNDTYRDSKLTENGIRQSKALKSRLQSGKGTYEKYTIEGYLGGRKERYLDVDAIVTSTLSRTIETAFHGIPVNADVPFLATELGRERIANYMCEKRRNLSEIKNDYKFVQIMHATAEEDDYFDEKETEDNLLKARLRARKFLKWVLNNEYKKMAYV